MDPIDYKLALDNAATAARLLSLVDLPAAQEQMNKADAVGPYIDPTLYREAKDGLRLQRDLLAAAKPLWQWAREMARM